MKAWNRNQTLIIPFTGGVGFRGVDATYDLCDLKTRERIIAERNLGGAAFVVDDLQDRKGAHRLLSLEYVTEDFSRVVVGQICQPWYGSKFTIRKVPGLIMLGSFESKREALDRLLDEVWGEARYKPNGARFELSYGFFDGHWNLSRIDEAGNSAKIAKSPQPYETEEEAVVWARELLGIDRVDVAKQ